MAKSSGMMSLPSPMTTKRRTPSMPGTVRLNCPLYHMPTSPNCLPYLRKTESSTIHGHCPATLGGGAFILAPNGEENLQTQASQAFQPGAFGQRVEQPRREIFIPAPHPTQFGVGATAKEGRTHHTDNLAQQFLLAP